MKKTIKNILAIASFVGIGTIAMAQSTPTPANDSTAISQRQQTLEVKKAFLEKELKQAESDNSHLQYGVSPDRMEMMQRANDSVCLELKSQLLTVNIELEEIRKATAANNLLQNPILQQIGNRKQ